MDVASRFCVPHPKFQGVIRVLRVGLDKSMDGFWDDETRDSNTRKSLLVSLRRVFWHNITNILQMICNCFGTNIRN